MMRVAAAFQALPLALLPLLLIFAAAPAAAADAAPAEPYDGPPALIAGRKIKLTAYGSLGAAYTRMLDRDGAVLNLEAALLLDRRLSLGLAAYGFTATPAGPVAADGTPREHGTGYGGFVARYAIFGNFPIYGSIGFVLGGGAISLHERREEWWDDEDWDPDPWDRHDDDWNERNARFDRYFVFQPEITLHTNVTRWLRFGVMGGYRLTSGVGRFAYQETDLNGVVAGGNVQLGWF